VPLEILLELIRIALISDISVKPSVKFSSRELEAIREKKSRTFQYRIDEKS